MDQLNSPVSNLSYIPSELSYDSPSVNLGLTDLLTSPGTGTQPASGPVDHIQAGLAAMRDIQPDYQTANQPTYFDYKNSGASRYVGSTNYNALGFDPELGHLNEYKYGNMQTSGDMYGNAFSGAGRLAASTFVDGWKGWGRMTDALFSWDSSKLMGSPEDLYQQNLQQKEIMDKYAIYQTENSEKTIFNRQLLGDMIQQSGFALGTTAQFLSEELLTMGLASGFSLTKLGLTSGARIAKGAYRVGEVASDAKKLGDIWKSEGVVKSIWEGAKKFVPLVGTADDVARAHKAGASALQMASIGMGGIKRSLAEMNMAMTEARMEAAGTYGDLYDKMYNDHLTKTGQAPVGEELDKMKQLALAGAEDNFKVNTGVLAVMNRIQFDNLFSKFGSERKLLKEMGQYGDDLLKVSGKVAGKEMTQVYEKGITGAIGAAGKIATDFGGKKAAWEVTKSLGRGISKWEVSEGIQELIQEGSNVALQDYYYDLYNGKTASMDRSVDKAVDSQMSQQGFKTFMMGALTGRLISPVTGAFGKAVELSRTSKEQRQTRDADFKESIDLVNKFYQNPNQALNEAIANFKVQDKVAQSMEEALNQRDEYYYNNAKDSGFAKLVSAAKKTEMLESVLDTIREYGNHIDEKQLKEAFPSVDPTENNITNAKAYFNKIADEVEMFSKTWETLKDKYGDLVRPELYQEGSEDQMIALRAKKALDDSLEILATNKFKSVRATERARKVYEQVQQNGNVGQSSAYAFRTMSNDAQMQKEIDVLELEIGLTEDAIATDPGSVSKDQKETLKKKRAELDAINEFKKHWVSEEDNKTALLNTPALKKAYTDYLNARNASSNIDTAVTVTDIDESWNMFMDYAFLNKDNLAYTDAFNTLANPTRFVQMFDASREAMAAVMERFRKESAEEVQEKQMLALPPSSTPVAADPQTPADPAGPAPEGEKKTQHYVVKLPSGKYVVYNPKGKEVSMTFDNEADAQEEAEALDEMILGIKKGETPAAENPQSKNPVTPQPAVDADSEQAKEINSLSLADTTAKTLEKASKAVKKIYDKIMDNQPMIALLIQKIQTVKNKVYQGALMSIVTGKSSDEGGFQPINNGMQDNIGIDLENIKAQEAYNGLVVGGDKTVVETIGSGKGELNSRVRIRANADEIRANAKKANDLGIKNRSHYTYETPSQVKKLQAGQSVLTMGRKIEGVNLKISDKSGTGSLWVGGLDNYFIVQPNNITTPVTFDYYQKEFIMQNLLIDGNQMTDEQFDMLRTNYLHYEQFQDDVLELLGDATEGDVTELFNQYFTLSSAGVAAANGESMDEVFKNNPERLFDVQVKNEAGEVSTQRVPLIAYRQNGVWRMDFVTNSGEYVVDANGDSIDRVEKYVEEELGIKPVFGDNIPPYVWIANAPRSKNGHFVKFLNRDSGTQPVEGYKTFLLEFDKLQQTIEAGKKTNEFKYDGQIFTSTNALMTYFNQDKFGFFTVGDWFVDLSYSPKSSTNPFTIEMRPKNTQDRRSLTADEKKALNVFFGIKPLATLTESIKASKTTSQEVIDNYNAWMGTLTKNFREAVLKLRESENPKLKQFGTTINTSTLFYYEKEGDEKNYMLKLKAKGDTPGVAPLLQFQGASNNVSGINISFNTTPTPVVSTAKKKPTGNVKPAANPAPVAVGEPVSLAEYGTDAEGMITFNNQTLKSQVRNPKTNPVRVPGEEVIDRHLRLRLDNEINNIEPGENENWESFVFNIERDDDNLTEIILQNADNGEMLGSLRSFYERNKEMMSADFRTEVEAVIAQENNLRAKYTTALNDVKKKGAPAAVQLSADQIERERISKITDPEARKVAEITYAFASIAASVGEASATKIRDYAQRIMDGESKEKVLQGVGKSFTEAVEKLLALQTPSAPQNNDPAFNPDPFTPEEDPFMLNDKNYDRYTESIYNDEIQWLLNNANIKAAGITISDLGGIIEQLAAGKEVLGYYKNKVIYVNRLMSATGTVYHEAFHGLFRNVLNSKDRTFFLEKAKAKMGAVSAEKIEEFRKDRNYFNKTNEQIVDLMAEEVLADGFRAYKLSQKEPAEGWFKRFVKLLERLFNFLSRTDIDQLYRDFDAGVVKSDRNQADNIADEGVFELATGRPMLTLRPNGEGVMQIRPITDPRFLRPLNMEVQKEVVNKLVRMVSDKAIGTFAERFTESVAELKAQYDIDNLVAQNPDQEEAIRNKYGNFFNEAAFILGAEVSYDTDDSLAGNSSVAGYKVPVGANKRSLDIIKNEVNSKINSLGLGTGWISDDYAIPEDDDEARVEKEKGGEFDLIHMNPLGGISKEFRSLFSLIPYMEKDADLGVEINRVADGNMLFNAVIKVAADRPSKEILPALVQAVEALEEDGDRKAIQLRALTNELSKQFGISDLLDANATPSKNIFLYKQFQDTFFVTELPANVVVVYLDPERGSRTSMYDASINKDINARKESIAFAYDRAFKKLRTDDEKLAFANNFADLKNFIKTDLDRFLDGSNLSNRVKLNEFVDELYDKLNAVNIVLPKLLLRRSLQAIYVVERDNQINANSKKTLQELEADQSLIKQGAYLEWTFFDMLSQVDIDQAQHLFADTRDEAVELTGNNQANIEGVNAILKKAVRMILKYDINSAIPVFQNAENANIWRYSRYTPPILLAQMVRERGVEAITELYPVLQPFLKDNPLFDGSEENNLLLKNLFIESFNGFREEIDGENMGGVTFGSIDTKALMISNLVSFMKRESIFTTKKNAKGKAQQHKIVTFKRSRTQEEATTTNFMVTARYKKYTDGDQLSPEFAKDMTAFFRQEYNRIQREWTSKDDQSVTRYKNYNDSDKGRAYQFHSLSHFFGEANQSDADRELRTALQDAMISAAKAGVPFEQMLTQDLNGSVIADLFTGQLTNYADSTFKVYESKLRSLSILQNRALEEGTYTFSQFLGNNIREDFKDVTLKAKGYSSVVELAKDHHLNTFINKLMVNQVFDGDMALGIKSAVDYYKRNKSGVISGNSMKRGYFSTAVVDNLQVFLNADDLTQPTADIAEEGLTGVDSADGQSYHTLNHRIQMMDSWGRLTPAVRAIMSAYKYRALTKEEIEELEEAKVVLNTIKTATGGVLEYYKLSEHLISRVDVSYLNPAKGSTEEAQEALDLLYTKIEQLEDKRVENPYREDISDIDAEIESLYTEVHDYWLPKKNRAKLHHFLNSMEMSGVDQVFDPNASKKTTMVPVALSMDSTTNLKASKSHTSGLFKFLQVETSGVKNRITDPSQSRQLISTYLNQLENEKVYENKSLAELALDYEKVMGDITKANGKKLDMALFKDGQLDISSVYKMMRRGLAEQGADSNTLKFFDLEDGKPVHNVNLPMIKKQFTYYYFSLYNDSVYSASVSGRSDILVSSYGYDVLYNKATDQIITNDEYMTNPEAYASDQFGTRHLGVTTEVNAEGALVYYVEVMIPKPLANSPAEEQLFLEKLNKFFSTRIPTEDKRSMVVCKVVDYIDAAYRNSIVVPQLVHILAGSDLDVDKLYSHTFEHYTDYNDQPHVYGDYSNYKTESQGKFAEYIMYMAADKTLKDLISDQMDVVTANPVMPASFSKLKEELGLSEMQFSKEDLVEVRKALEDKRAQLVARYQKDKIAHDTAFQAMLDAGKGDQQAEDAFNKARAQFIFIREQRAITQAELTSTREELAKMNNTLKLLALHQVLLSHGYPTTQKGLSDFITKNGNPVVPVLQNERLQMKMDILSNATVFNTQYIKEKSDVQQFKDVALSIGARIDDVVNANSVYSVMGDVVANELNSSNKDGIGITASFNKFLAFAQKNKLVLPYAVNIYNEANGDYTIHQDFQDKGAIRQIGSTLGMFADAAKEPIPSVLNLNPETAHVSNMLTAIGVPINVALLINKVPFIEKATQAVLNSQTNAKGTADRETAVSSEIGYELASILQKFETEGRLEELYDIKKDKSGNKTGMKIKQFIIRAVEPNPSAFNMEDASVADFGFSIMDMTGKVVDEDAAKFFLGTMYNELNDTKGNVLALGNVLNLIKGQQPSFYQLDKVLGMANDFMTAQKGFKAQIGNALINSKEYNPLLTIAAEQSRNATQVLLDRSSLFKHITGAVTGSFYKATDSAKESISQQFVKFIMINRTKVDMRAELAELKAKENANPAAIKTLEDGLKLFTADFWTNNQDEMASRLEYMFENHQGNPFVEFLKMTKREGISYFEAASRMKLDKDIAEGIILGYEALQKSLDPETKVLSRFLFYYLLAKDGLGYGSNTFINYISPDLKQYRDVSNVLTEFHEVIKSEEPYIKKQVSKIEAIKAANIDPARKQQEIAKITSETLTQFNGDFDKLFKHTGNPVDWIDQMMRKVFTNAANQKYYEPAYAMKATKTDDKKVLQEAFDKGLLGNRKYTIGKQGRIDLFEENLTAFEFDFSNQTVSPQLEKLARSNRMTLLKGDEGQFIGVFFPMIVKTATGKLMKLKTLDGMSMSQQMAMNILSGDVQNGFSGFKAEYGELKVEGAEKLNNLGFTNKDGAAIQSFVQEGKAKAAAVKNPDSTRSIGNFTEDNSFEIQIIRKGDAIPIAVQRAETGKGQSQVKPQMLLSKSEILDIYTAKDRDETLQSFSNRIADFITSMGSAAVSKNEIIEQLKSCL